MIVVVGIGADGMSGLAAPSLVELRRATVVYGSRRQLGLLDDTVKAEHRQWPSPMLDVLDTLRAIDGDAHVLASGDPMLHGVGRLLIAMIGADKVTVL
ncbi:MAG: precorrin-6y C5,15-methyltransferase (decarboxylating), CbiE and CbiT subunit, partial [Mycobacterium sp.]|nr:precorrin-6y C5,15-methyltransferase (decarboxylating), CbiE and CbiT subunit [Mycobacterium sp.]